MGAPNLDHGVYVAPAFRRAYACAHSVGLKADATAVSDMCSHANSSMPLAFFRTEFPHNLPQHA
jgi:hypothetical protein